MSEERKQFLLDRYMAATASEIEVRELFALLDESAGSAAVRSKVRQLWDQYDMELESAPAKPANSINMFALRAVAASLILAVFGVWFLLRKPGQKEAVINPLTGQIDILPGSNKALLTLGDGSQISLDSAHDGVLASQSGLAIRKTGDGEISYQDNKMGDRAVISHNTLSTPRGGQFQLVLSDGTKVWMNAASSIRYPAAFSGKERRVVVTGEVYFEVVHNDRHPFIVSVNGLSIQDVGTHFNIKAYQDEPEVVTTLLEGSVRIGSHIVTAGEKAVVGQSGEILVTKGNLEQAVAWKNGQFYFTNADFQTVMREMGRWYNLDIRYESEIPRRQFEGMIGRSLTLDQLLKGLSVEGVHYRIREGNLLIIKP